MDGKEGRGYSYPSDIWSLGLIVYEMATGTHAYPEAQNFLHFRELVLSTPLPTLPEEYFSEGIRDFMSHCLQLDPKDRVSAIDLIEHPWIQESMQADAEMISWASEVYEVIQKQKETQGDDMMDQQMMTELEGLTGLK